jgi:pyrimidine-nucleoside phosphorylase
MRERSDAVRLATALVSTGTAFGVKTLALITDMNQPLGQSVGNSLEVLECINILRGEVSPRAKPVLDLSLELTARMVQASGLENSIERARTMVRAELDTGRPLEVFRRNVEEQGGNPRVCDNPESILDLTASAHKIESPSSGVITAIDTFAIGNIVAGIGGGRVRIDDSIDPAVGFAGEVSIGDEIHAGDTLGFAYLRDGSGDDILQKLAAAYSIGEAPTTTDLELVKEVIE